MTSPSRPNADELAHLSPEERADRVERALIPDRKFHLDLDADVEVDPHTDPVFTGRPTCAIHGEAMEKDSAGHLFCAPCHATWVSGLETAEGP